MIPIGKPESMMSVQHNRAPRRIFRVRWVELAVAVVTTAGIVAVIAALFYGYSL